MKTNERINGATGNRSIDSIGNVCRANMRDYKFYFCFFNK